MNLDLIFALDHSLWGGASELAVPLTIAPKSVFEPFDPCPPGMPTCLLCTCLGGSVYCDDLKLDSVPPLPKDTTHFYARYNRITKISKSDFAFMSTFLLRVKSRRFECWGGAQAPCSTDRLIKATIWKESKKSQSNFRFSIWFKASEAREADS